MQCDVLMYLAAVMSPMGEEAPVGTAVHVSKEKREGKREERLGSVRMSVGVVRACVSARGEGCSDNTRSERIEERENERRWSLPCTAIEKVEPPLALKFSIVTNSDSQLHCTILHCTSLNRRTLHCTHCTPYPTLQPV